MALLSDAKARNIKPDDKPLPHGGITGLTLHPSTTKGRGKWVLRYVSPTTGKRRNAGLGICPEISVADAGNQARLMREQLVKGFDPLEVKKYPLWKLQPAKYTSNYSLADAIPSMVNSGSPPLE